MSEEEEEPIIKQYLPEITTRRIDLLSGLALGFLVGVIPYYGVFLDWVRAWSSVLQLILFLILTGLSIHLSRESGQVLENQEEILQDVKRMIYSDTQEPYIHLEIIKEKELESHEEFEATLRISNLGGQAENVIIKPVAANEYIPAIDREFMGHEYRQRLRGITLPKGTSSVLFAINRKGLQHSKQRLAEVIDSNEIEEKDRWDSSTD